MDLEHPWKRLTGGAPDVSTYIYIREQLSLSDPPSVRANKRVPQGYLLYD